MIGMGGSLPLPEGIALDQELLGGSIEVFLREHLVIEGIRATGRDVKEGTDRNGVLQGLGGDPFAKDGPGILRCQFARSASYDLQEDEGCLEGGGQLRLPEILKGGEHLWPSQCSRRDSAMSPNTEGARIPLGGHGRHQFPLSDAPGAFPAHGCMRPSTHGVATELFVVKGDPRCIGQTHTRHQGNKADEDL